jgi:hypothetical protein
VSLTILITLFIKVIMSASSSTIAVSKKHPVGCFCSICEDYIADELSGVELVSSGPVNRPLAVDMSHIKSLLRQGVVHKGKGKGSFKSMKPIRVKLTSQGQNYTSGAGASNSINTNVAFSTTNFPELADFSVVYDEVRVLNITMHYYASITTAGTTLIAPCAFSVAFDPTVGTPSSVTTVVEEQYAHGPMMLMAGINGGSNQSGNFLQKYHKLRAKVPGPLAIITSSDCPGNAWFTVDAGTAPIILVNYSYITALGGSGVSTISVYYELDCEFRLRT